MIRTLRQIGNRSGALALLLTLSIALAAGPARAEEEIARLAGSLVKLRGEVESMYEDLNQRKTEMQDKLRSLAAQKTELEVQVRKEELRLRQVEESLARRRETLRASELAGDRLKPAVSRSAQALRGYIKAGLPFRREERLAELNSLEEQVLKDVVEPQKALARLWAMAEDEIRLTRESGVYRQTIEIGGEEMLADVARVGMTMLFFETGDGRVGMAAQSDSGWTYRAMNDPQNRERIVRLFDSFKKQVRQGYFELPNALAALGEGAK